MKRKKLFFAFWGILLLALTLAGIFREWLLESVSRVVIVKVVAVELGLEISVDKISGSLFRDLRLTGVRTVKPAEHGMLVSIDVSDLHARYSLPMLLRGTDVFIDNLGLEAEGAHVVMDFVRNGEEEGQPAAPSSLPLVLPHGTVRNSSIDLKGEGWHLVFAETDITVTPGQEQLHGIPLTIHARRSELELPGLHRQTPELSATGVLSRYGVRIDSLEVNGRKVVEEARIEYEPGKPILCAGSFTAFSGSGKIRALFASRSTEVDWDVTGVDASAVTVLLNQDELRPEGKVTTSGSLVGDFDKPDSLTGKVSLQAEMGSFQGIPFKHIELVGETADRILRIHTFMAEMTKNVISCKGVSVPLAGWQSGGAKNAATSITGRFAATLEDIPALMGLVGITDPNEYLPDKIPSHRLEVAGRLAGDRIILESASFTAPGSVVTIKNGEAILPRTGAILDGLRLSGKLSAHIKDLGLAGAVFGVESVGGGLVAEVTFDGLLKNLRSSIEIKGNNLRYRGSEVDSLLLSAEGDRKKWKIENLKATKGDDHITATGNVTLQPIMLEGFVLDFTLRDFHQYFSWFLEREVPPARGRLTGRLELSGPPASPTGSFHIVLTDAVIANLPLTEAELLGQMKEDLVEVSDFKVRTANSGLELAGSVRHRAWGLPLTGSIERMTLSDRNISSKLVQPVAFTVGGMKAWSLTEANIQGDAGVLHLEGSVSPYKGYDIRFRVAKLGSEAWPEILGFLPFEFRGIDLEGSVTGDQVAPEIKFTGMVNELRAPKAPVSLDGQVDLHLSAAGLTLNKFEWKTETGEMISVTGEIPYNPFARKLTGKELQVEGIFSAPELGIFMAFLPENLRTTGSLHGTMRISGTGEHPEARVDLKARDLRLPPALPVSPPGSISLDAIAMLKDNNLRLETFKVNGRDFNVSVSGTWLDAGMLFAGVVAMDSLPGTLDLRGEVALADIGWLGRGVGAIRRVGGKIEGSMAVSGPASRPDIAAELYLADGELRAEGAMPGIRDLSGHIKFKGGMATIDRLQGTVGGSPFTITGSVVLAPEGAQHADLRVRGDNILLYRNENVLIRADADITVRGRLTAPAFSGTVALTEGRLLKNINWLEPLQEIGRGKLAVPGGAGRAGIGFSFQKPPLKDATFNVHVLSTSPFQIKSNVAKGALRPDLWLRGTGEIPVITGVVYVDPSRVLLPGGRFSIESGIIRFQEKKPGRPELEISGSSRMLGYDITATVEGPYDEPTITLSSVPPLSQDLLLRLVLTGTLPSDTLNQPGASQGGMNVALYVSQGVLQDWFGSNDLDGDESLLERLEVVTGRGISRLGNETIGAQYRLADDVLRDGDELYLVAERDIYDEVNVGLKIVFRFK